jgi:Protein of unknown function (DUF2950)
MHRMVIEPDQSVTLYVGAENWPMPISIVKNGNGAWYFDEDVGHSYAFRSPETARPVLQFWSSENVLRRILRVSITFPNGFLPPEIVVHNEKHVTIIAMVSYGTS